MLLTKEQQAILDGEQGETLAKVMKTLVLYGEAFEAEKLVPITSKYNHLVTSFGLKVMSPVPDSNHFTGGNHEYTNTGSGGTPTGRTEALKVLADNREISNGSGTCNLLEIRWTNYVQATNTKKEDGTGREVLRENHILTFDGISWKTYVEIIPLESVTISTWYGLQGCGTNSIYNNIRYIGAENRALCDGGSYSSCGNVNATKVMCFGENHKMEIEVDPGFDLGDHRFSNGVPAIFAEKYGKVYFHIVNNKTLDADCLYCLRGTYKFMPV